MDPLSALSIAAVVVKFVEGRVGVFASGDAGVANRYSSQSNNTCLTPRDVGDRFSPSFPSNHPWVTTVSGTYLKSRNVSDGEVAVALPYTPNPRLDYYSAGGFSNAFQRQPTKKWGLEFEWNRNRWHSVVI